MSWQACPEAQTDTKPALPDCVDLEIVPRTRDIGAFEVGRVLPTARRRTVGPFIFFDQMGPAVLPAGTGMDVRPHPHIGLATITYLFEGAILHRDSLGNVQLITPGDVNWMTAGRGIVHSERSDPELRKGEQRVHGLQLWVALPTEHEEVAPDFTHYPKSALPVLDGDGVDARLIAGTLFGKTSPVKTLSNLFYADIKLRPGAVFTLEADYEDRALYLVSGRVEIDGRVIEPGRMLVFRPGSAVAIKAAGDASFVVLGGEPLDGPRHIWWNFVSSRPERIEEAKTFWRERLFNAPIADDPEFIPLPDTL